MTCLSTLLLASWFMLVPAPCETAETTGTTPDDRTATAEEAPAAFKEAWFLETYRKDPEAALALYAELKTERAGTAWAGEALERMATFLHKAGHAERALAAVRELREGYPDFARRADKLEKRFTKSRNDEEAASRNKREKDLKGRRRQDGERGLTSDADAASSQERPSSQERLAEARNPKNNDILARVEAMLSRARTLRDEGRKEEALKVLREAYALLAQVGRRAGGDQRGREDAPKRAAEQGPTGERAGSGRRRAAGNQGNENRAGEAAQLMKSIRRLEKDGRQEEADRLKARLKEIKNRQREGRYEEGDEDPTSGERKNREGGGVQHPDRGSRQDVRKARERAEGGPARQAEPPVRGG